MKIKNEAPRSKLRGDLAKFFRSDKPSSAKATEGFSSPLSPQKTTGSSAKENKQLARIFLVRHGQVLNPKHIIYGYLPVPLDKKGQAQAKRAGLVLKKKNIAAIFTSPQRRCQQTAKIIKKIIGGKIKIITSNELRESGLGHASEGLVLKDLRINQAKIWHDYWRTPAKVKAGGENLAKMAERVLRVITKEVKKRPGQNLVFVSHRDPILAALLKLSKRSFNDLHKVKHFCDKGSVLEVIFNGRNFINRNF